MFIVNQQRELQMNLVNNKSEQLSTLYSALTSNSDISIFVTAGKEGNRHTYTGKIGFQCLADSFDIVPTSSSGAESLRIQRELKSSRTNSISKYILENEDFIFPEVIAICEDFSVELALPNSNVYKLTLPASSFRYLTDGQGRLSGIKSALTKKPELQDFSLDIKFVKSEGVERDNQVFADTNMLQTQPNKSVCVAMDSRISINKFTRELISENSYIKDRVDFQQASVSASSTSNMLWTLNQLVSFVQLVTGTTKSSFEKKMDAAKQAYWKGFIHKFIDVMSKHPQIGTALNSGTPANETREASIIGTSVFLKSLGIVGKIVALHFINSGAKKADWSILDDWHQLDLSKNNDDWIGRCRDYRGVFADKAFNQKATASAMISSMGIELPEELELIEDEVLMAKAEQRRIAREAKKLEQADSQAQESEG